MPIDPRIALGVQAPAINTPFESLGQIVQLQRQQQQMRANEQLMRDRQAQEDQRRAQIATEQRKQSARDTVNEVMSKAIKTGADGVSRFDENMLMQGLAARGLASEAPDILKTLNESYDATLKIKMADEKHKQDQQTFKNQSLAALGYGIDLAGNTPQDFYAAVALAQKNHDIEDKDLQPYLDAVEKNPEAVGKITGQLIALNPTYLERQQQRLASQKPVTMSPGQQMVDPATGRVVASVPEKAEHSAAYKEWQDYKASGGDKDFDAYMTMDANRKRPTVNLGGLNALYAQTDPKEIAAGIRRGDAPPDLTQYGRVVQGAVSTLLMKPGPNGEPPFQLANAKRIWDAQKRLNSTLNGAQQVRLDQSIRSGLQMYDKIDDLADQWQGMGLGPLSRANLTLAHQGAKGQKAQELATQLTGQIAQLTSDVATIEQGGMTPTNESRAVAEKSLQDWWSNRTIRAMTAQGRANMKIRELARGDTQVAVSGNTPPPAAAPAKLTADELIKKYSR